MNARPRMDLDGVALLSAENPTTALAIFRHRTTNGLTFLMPESADFSVDWEHIESAVVDLQKGQIEIQFSNDYIQNHNWLRGQKTLVGHWMDRYTMGNQSS